MGLGLAITQRLVQMHRRAASALISLFNKEELRRHLMLTAAVLSSKNALSRRATSVLLPPRPAPRVTLDGFRDRLGVCDCSPVGHLLHFHPRELLRLSRWMAVWPQLSV